MAKLVLFPLLVNCIHVVLTLHAQKIHHSQLIHHSSIHYKLLCFQVLTRSSPPHPPIRTLAASSRWWASRSRSLGTWSTGTLSCPPACSASPAPVREWCVVGPALGEEPDISSVADRYKFYLGICQNSNTPNNSYLHSWASACEKGVIKWFLKFPLACLGSTAAVELSEIISQSLLQCLMPQAVYFTLILEWGAFLISFVFALVRFLIRISM